MAGESGESQYIKLKRRISPFRRAAPETLQGTPSTSRTRFGMMLVTRFIHNRCFYNIDYYKEFELNYNKRGFIRRPSIELTTDFQSNSWTRCLYEF